MNKRMNKNIRNCRSMVGIISMFLCTLFGLSGCLLNVSNESDTTAAVNYQNYLDHFIVGSYGTDDNTGIHLISYDKTTKRLVKERLLSRAYNPSYIAWEAERQTLYSIATTINNEPLLQKYTWNQQSRKLDLVISTSIDGRGICHININSQTQQVAIANYTSGDIQIFNTYNEKLQLAQMFANQGSSLTKRQKSPHLHFVGWGNNSRFLYASDLGTDEILVFDSQQNALSLIQRIELVPGDGPRHLAFHPRLNIIYSLNELSNTISVYQQAPQSGMLSFVDKAYLHPDKKQEQVSIASAIRVSNDGNHLYVAVRGENMLYGFNVEQTGKLSFINKVASGGKHPRDFNFSASQQYLLVANQHSNQLNMIMRDVHTGRLSLSQTTLALKKPSVVVAFDD